jgi:segregation and condensation protein A
VTDALAASEFEAAEEAAAAGQALVVDIEGYEGPLHMLLALARAQKVDLLKISVLELAEQYLAFVQEARRRSFSLAADYLVMAAWLAYLKSRLLLPKPEKPVRDEPPAEELAAALSFRLLKLDAMRQASDQLQARPRWGVEVFGRGDPDAVKVVASTRVQSSLHDLLQAYVGQRRRDVERRYQPRAPEAYALDDARQRLRRMLPELRHGPRWRALLRRRGAPAGRGLRAPPSCLYLSASLELVKEGALEARQLTSFDDLYLRLRRGEPVA